MWDSLPALGEQTDPENDCLQDWICTGDGDSGPVQGVVHRWLRKRINLATVGWTGGTLYELLSQVIPQIYLASKRMPLIPNEYAERDLIEFSAWDEEWWQWQFLCWTLALQSSKMSSWTMLRRWDDKQRVRRRIGKERCPGVCHTSLEQNNMIQHL